MNAIVYESLFVACADLDAALATFARECPEDYPLLRRLNQDADSLRRELRNFRNRLQGPVTKTAFERAASGDYEPIRPLHR